VDLRRRWRRRRRNVRGLYSHGLTEEIRYQLRMDYR
jgi:hypothetical protein